MNIQQLNREELETVLREVDVALRGAPRPTKAIVVRTLANRQLYSPLSTGVEKTLMKTAQAKGVQLPTSFASLMGQATSAPAPATPATATPATAPRPTAPPAPLLPAKSSEAQCLVSFAGGVSYVEVTPNGTGIVKFSDGGTESCGPVDVRALGSNYSLLPLTESSR